MTIYNPFYVHRFQFLLVLALGFSFLVSNTSYCQNDVDPHGVAYYDFINYEENKLLYYKDSSGFEAIFDIMDELILNGKGKLNIVHFGGSHIQADVFSGRFRQRLHDFYPGISASRGLVFPYRMARSNNPWNYFTEHTGDWQTCRNVEKDKTGLLGVSGISAITTDSISNIDFMFRTREYPSYDFNRVRVFHNMDSTFSVDIVHPDVSKKVSQNIEDGFTLFELDGHLDTLSLSIQKTDSLQRKFELYGVSLETEEPGITYHSVGINGASVPSYLRCSLLPRQLKTLQPDLIIFSMGINDAHTTDFNPQLYEQHYDSLIYAVRSVSPHVKIIFTTNNDSYYKRRYVNKNGELVRETMIRLAQKHSDCAVWDLYTIMGGLNSIRKWENEKLAKKDKIHFTNEGYRILGDLFFSAFLKSYDAHITNKFN